MSSLREVLSKKSDLELIRKINDNTHKVLSTPLSNSASVARSNAFAAKTLKEENDICQSILDERSRIYKRNEELQKCWQDEVQIRKKKMILSYKNAVSYEGQLIAAILEEENGKTLAEIYDWYDEFASMDEPDFEKLLSGLVTERIIKFENGKYFLNHILEEDFGASIESNCDGLLETPALLFSKLLRENGVMLVEAIKPLMINALEKDDEFKNIESFRRNSYNSDNVCRAQAQKLVDAGLAKIINWHSSEIIYLLFKGERIV